ncbi:MAG: hypothetical protein HYZ51_03575 [Candidatus Doudnabacteria bacterium]|nr:hypothetical protein [Candidatus Doudnabacteria bacterium]
MADKRDLVFVLMQPDEANGTPIETPCGATRDLSRAKAAFMFWVFDLNDPEYRVLGWDYEEGGSEV